MIDSWRLFIAVEVPPDARRALERVQAELQREVPDHVVRWVRPEGIHVALKFLGDVPRGSIAEIQLALEEAVRGHGPFSLTAFGLGAFPNTRRPRVVWIGVEGEIRRLKALRRSVEETVSPLGYPSEDRPFEPHLTLGRVERGASRSELDLIGDLVERSEIGELASWRVEAVSLMRSELKPGGAVYTEVYRAPLLGAG